MSEFRRRASRRAWPQIRKLARNLVWPIQRILAVEAASGIALIVAAAIAIGWANSPWADLYQDALHAELAVSLGPWAYAQPVHHWINDGLMTLFFFVVGLELRGELHHGHLRTPRRAALPALAAVGGMLVPAAIYGALNAGHAGAAGWGVPMATDIAFAVGVLTLLGTRVGPAPRVLLLALAVIDDLGAILVIAVFYAAGIAWQGLAIVAAGLAIVGALRAAGVRAPILYVVPGIVVWAGMARAGVHPTLAGVVLGLLAPVDAPDDPDTDEDDQPSARSPAAQLQRALHPWVAFGVMPLFALANAGVAIGGASLTGDGGRVFVGIIAGLVVGKPLGVYLACRAALRAGVADAPGDLGARGIAIVGVVAGIGFTMSLFVAQLAFPPGALRDTAVLAILVASAVAALLGLAVGAAILPKRPSEQALTPSRTPPA